MLKRLAVALVATTMLAACTTDPYTGQQKVSNTAGGAALGAGLGALAGLAVGGSSNAQRNAVLIGAGIGALTGGAIGDYHGPQRSRTARPAPGNRRFSVTRTGDQIILNMPSDITFATDQDAGEGRLLPDAEFGRAGA